MGSESSLEDRVLVSDFAYQTYGTNSAVNERITDFLTNDGVRWLWRGPELAIAYPFW